MHSTRTSIRGRRLLVAAVAVGTVATVGACGSADAPAATKSKSSKAHSQITTATPEATPVVSVSRTKLYFSVRELAEDVQGVAVINITPGSAETVPADRDGKSAIDATIATAQVARVIHGNLPETLSIRLITSPATNSEVPPPLEPGGTYVLFLIPFEWSPGVPTGEFTVPGGAGIYEISKAGELDLVSRGQDVLPKQFGSTDELVADLNN